MTFFDNEINFEHSISIVIPLHNKSATILLTLNKIKKDLKNLNYEIIIVENGSTDDSFIITNQWCKLNSDLNITLTTSSVGLGSALKKGFSLAQNSYIWVVPADMQVGVSDLKSFISNFDKNTYLYIGSRHHQNSVVFRHWSRKPISAVFNKLKKILIQSEISDTMGSIIAEKKHLKEMYLLPKTNKFFYITELISYYELNKFKVLEIPVETYSEIDMIKQNRSTVNLLVTPFEIIYNLFVLRKDLKTYKHNNML